MAKRDHEQDSPHERRTIEELARMGGEPAGMSASGPKRTWEMQRLNVNFTLAKRLSLPISIDCGQDRYGRHVLG